VRPEQKFDIKVVCKPGKVRYAGLMKRAGFALPTVLLITSSYFAAAQVQTVSRSISGRPDTDIQIGVYVNVNADCTSGQLPSIQLVSPPENGKVAVKEAKVRATNYKQCLGLEVPGFVAFYHSRADFLGVDVITLEVKYIGGRTEIQKISVTIGQDTPGKGT